MEVFIEEDEVAPMRVFLELLRPSVDRPPAICIAQENTRQSTLNLLGHFEQGHVAAGTSRALNFELIAVEAVQVHQASNDQRIDWHPHWPPPVGVAAEHPAI